MSLFGMWGGSDLENAIIFYGVSKTHFCKQGTQNMFWYKEVSKLPSFVYGGLENAIFVCGGLENSIFVCGGSQKCNFVARGLKNVHPGKVSRFFTIFRPPIHVNWQFLQTPHSGRNRRGDSNASILPFSEPPTEIGHFADTTRRVEIRVEVADFFATFNTPPRKLAIFEDPPGLNRRGGSRFSQFSRVAWGEAGFAKISKRGGMFNIERRVFVLAWDVIQ